MFRSIAYLLLALSLTPIDVRAADSTWQSRGGNFIVSYDSDLQPVVINRIHRWTLSVTDSANRPVEGATLSVDGGMPEHDHGLPTRPRVTRETSPGHYLLEGMRFHMNGTWEIEITIDAGGKSDVAIIELEL